MLSAATHFLFWVWEVSQTGDLGVRHPIASSAQLTFQPRVVWNLEMAHVYPHTKNKEAPPPVIISQPVILSHIPIYLPYSFPWPVPVPYLAARLQLAGLPSQY